MTIFELTTDGGGYDEDGERTLFYDLDDAKKAGEEWLTDNGLTMPSTQWESNEWNDALHMWIYANGPDRMCTNCLSIFPREIR